MDEVILFLKKKLKQDCPPVDDVLSPDLNVQAHSGEIYDHLLKIGVSTDILTYPAFEKLLETMVNDGKIPLRTISNWMTCVEWFEKSFEKNTTLTLSVSDIKCAKDELLSL
ncbi:hypothetical protein RF11_10177 [Thelohanellus kitauei]|uniref:Uncharacterized protein n=1 Tax=Thelohanellus kitauei TaxID=669202 RepID=A0A0C2NAM4_THEKT|nr:hypothetical protein RF11_10177 [Thelohanellus kitauei]